MKTLSIVQYPADILITKCNPIETITEETWWVANEMIRLLAEAKGLGLAANQVGYPYRMFVAALPGTNTIIYINPVLSRLSPKKELGVEGCLSLPGIEKKIWYTGNGCNALNTSCNS